MPEHSDSDHNRTTPPIPPVGPPADRDATCTAEVRRLEARLQSEPQSLLQALDGAIRPCCHVGRSLGNIYDAPLRDNTAYLRARTAFMAGRIYDQCMSVISCEYTQMLRRRKRIPAFITP